MHCRNLAARELAKRVGEFSVNCECTPGWVLLRITSPTRVASLQAMTQNVWLALIPPNHWFTLVRQKQTRYLHIIT